MKQFWKILSFELTTYFKNKIIVGITVFLVLLMAGILFYPRLMARFDADTDKAPQSTPATMLVKVADPSQAVLGELFKKSFEGYIVCVTDHDTEAIKKEIKDGSAACAFVISDSVSCSYYVKQYTMGDMNPEIADQVLRRFYQEKTMLAGGLSAEQTAEILNVETGVDIEVLIQDRSSNILYTYIVVFALYIVIMLYGQMVSTNVAIEKSSRAMELLITSADPCAMMFGKIIASCMTGLLQLIAVFGSALLFYSINKKFWEDNIIISSIFSIPCEILVYMLVFFVLGFLVYAFLFGAIGSLASKLEDINISTIPLMILFVVAFIIVTAAVSANNVESTLMKVCSFIPFTSPMAMFARIAMSSVPVYEIVTSVSVLIFSTVGIGFLAAKIYRVGVLLYGTPPKIGTVIKSIWLTCFVR